MKTKRPYPKATPGSGAPRPKSKARPAAPAREAVTERARIAPRDPDRAQPSESGGRARDRRRSKRRHGPRDARHPPQAAKSVPSPRGLEPAPVTPDAGEATSPPPRKTVSRAPAVIAQIRELEEHLDRLIDEASRRDLSSLAAAEEDEPDCVRTPGSALTTSDARAPDAPPESEPPPPRSVPSPRASAERLSAASLATSERAVFDTARELLSSDFYLRKWGRLAMRGRSEEVDDFGFDPIYEQKARRVFEFLYTRYFRVETTGVDRVPARGRCLLVANHSGTLPLDGIMLKTAVKLEHAAPRDVRWLTEDFITHMPYLGGAMNRLGAVRACQENAERLLAKEQLVAVFPEGVKGIGKLFSERYRLQRFGRGGFIKLSLRTETPIVPVAIVGAEETNPLLFRVESLAKAFGLPYVPITPTFPALGPLGLLPAPTKWQIHFGEPLDFRSHGREAADDELLVGKLAERVRATIQGMVDRVVGARKSVFFG